MDYVDVCAVTLGHNQWEKYTLPLIRSLQKHEPNMPIVVVDNGSDPPYPQLDGVHLVQSDNESVAKALNVGMSAAPRAWWYLILGNDVECTGQFSHRLNLFDYCTIYGAQTKDWKVFEYIIGWCMLISRFAWYTVGPFDEQYRVFCYEEVDWCYRAYLEGFQQQQIDLPFHHYEHGSHKYVPNIEEVRRVNKAMFLRKFGLHE